MKFLLDANVEYRLASHLRSLGRDVKTIATDYPSALEDTAVLAIAVKEKRILLTNDRDFGELIIRQNYPHHGVIYFHLKNSKDIEAKLKYLQTVLSDYTNYVHEYVVIDARGIRIRRTSPRIEEQKKAA